MPYTPKRFHQQPRGLCPGMLLLSRDETIVAHRERLPETTLDVVRSTRRGILDSPRHDLLSDVAVRFVLLDVGEPAIVLPAMRLNRLSPALMKPRAPGTERRGRLLLLANAFRRRRSGYVVPAVSVSSYRAMQA